MAVARNTEGTLIEDLKNAREEMVQHGRHRDGYCADERYELLQEILSLPFDHPRVFAAVNKLVSHISVNQGLIEFNDNSTDQEIFDLWDKTLADLGGMG